MSSIFYGNQSDYIAKLNILADRMVSTSLNATVGGTTTLDCSLGGNFYVTMGAGNTTIDFSRIPAVVGLKLVVYVKKDNSATQRTITWPASVRWPGASVPVLTATANNLDIFEFRSVDSGTKFFGSTFGLNYVA